MKQLFFILSLFLVASAGAQNTSLIGQWKASKKEGAYYLVFGKDSTFMFKHGNDSLGGKSFMLGEGEATSAFKADTGSKPAQLNLLVIQKSSGEVIRLMECIYEYISPNKIRIRLNMDGSPRPKTFLPKGNEDTLVFVKQ